MKRKAVLKNLSEFTKTGFWLAVITQDRRMKVVASAKDPKVALKKARGLGFDDASLMQSAQHYAAWIS